MNKVRKIVSVTGLIIFCLSGCATTGKSTAVGGAVGAGTGAMVGAIADPGVKGQYRTRNILIGAALGGVVGLGTGALIGDANESRSKEAYDEGKKSAQASSHVTGSPPELKNAKVEARWIEGKTTGNRYIDGHWEYVIAEPARWGDTQ